MLIPTLLKSRLFRVELLTLIPLDPTKLNAIDLFGKFKGVLDEFQIPIKNVLAIATDNASVMAGSRRSFKIELKKHRPAAITITCICHKIVLIAKDAFKVFPIEIDKFLQDLVTFIRVPARVVKFRAICKRRWANQFN